MALSQTLNIFIRELYEILTMLYGLPHTPVVVDQGLDMLVRQGDLWLREEQGLRCALPEGEEAWSELSSRCSIVNALTSSVYFNGAAIFDLR